MTRAGVAAVEVKGVGGLLEEGALREKMKRVIGLLVASVVSMLFIGVAAADTLEMKDGRVLKGRYLGGTQAVLRFEINGEVQTFSTSEIVAITFTGGSASYAPAAAPAPAVAPAPAPGPAVAPTNMAPATSPAPATAAVSGGGITLPIGQSLLVRMIDGVDSSKNHVGDVFHASLDTDLVIGDTFVARRGTDVYGRLANAESAGHIAGSSELQLELTRIVIDGREYPVVSSDYTLEGKGRGKNTAEKVGGGAVLGAIIGAIAGGGKGAAIGTGVGAAAGGTVQVLTRGEQVRVPSETLLEFHLQQPTTVIPTQR